MVAVVFGIAAIPRTDSPKTSSGPQLIAQKEGRIMQLVLSEGEIAERGVDLVMLDDEQAQKALRLAQAELEQVMATAKGSDVAVALPAPPAGISGRIVQTGPLNPPRGSLGGGTSPLRKSINPLPRVEGTGDAVAEIEPKPDSGTLTKLRKEAQQEIEDAKAEEQFCLNEIENAKMALEEAQKANETSKAISDRAAKDVEDSRRLLAEGVISRNAFAQKEGQARMHASMLENNGKRVEEAQAKISQLNEALEKAKQRRTEAEAALVAAPEKATPKPSTVTKNHLPLTSGPRPGFVRKPAVVLPGNPEGSTAPAKVAIDQGAKMEADAKVTLAKENLVKAENAVLERRISAPRRMLIKKWLVTPSETIKPGQAIAEVEYLPEETPVSTPETRQEQPVKSKPEEPEGPSLPPGEIKPLQKDPQIPDNIR
jgi:hypothetical protein